MRGNSAAQILGVSGKVTAQALFHMRGNLGGMEILASSCQQGEQFGKVLGPTTSTGVHGRFMLG